MTGGEGIRSLHIDYKGDLSQGRVFNNMHLIWVSIKKTNFLLLKNIHSTTNKQNLGTCSLVLNKSLLFGRENDWTFPVRTHHQVAHRDMWRIFNMKVINLFTWRRAGSAASPTDRPTIPIINQRDCGGNKARGGCACRGWGQMWVINKDGADGDAAEGLCDSLISPFSGERLPTARSAAGGLCTAPHHHPPAPEDGVRGKEEEKEVTEL